MDPPVPADSPKHDPVKPVLSLSNNTTKSCTCSDLVLFKTVSALERSISNLSSKVDQIYAAVKKSRYMATSTSSASPSSQSSDAEGYVKMEGYKEEVDDPKYVSVSAIIIFWQ